MTTSAVPSFTFDLPIASDDIDHLGHVNNAVYLKWVQAAVVGHWTKLATPQEFAEHLWIALRHEIDYRKPAFPEDNVVAKVVLDSVRGARAWYSTFIMRGEEVLAEVKSTWCCIDAETRHPVRIARDIVTRFFER
jgi:acyl-CoA thioester hydrolase